MADRQCRPCPWRDIAGVQAEFPEALAAAEENPDGFVCHTRCVPCPGPRLAGLGADRPDRLAELVDHAMPEPYEELQL